MDRETGALASAATPILDELGRGHEDGHPKAKHELFECTIEVITGICATPAEAKGDLSATIDEVRRAAATRELDLMSAGSHPFSHPHEQIVSPDPRYAALIEEMQWTARRLQIFGIHYHVGRALGGEVDRDRERAAVLPRPPARPVGVEPVLGGPRHRPGVVPGEGVRAAAHGRAAPGHPGLDGLRAVHAHARRRRGDQDDPRGVVGHPPAPELRDRRAAHLRRDADVARDRRSRRAGAEPRAPHRPAARREPAAVHRPRVDGPAEQVAGRPARSRREAHRRRRGVAHDRARRGRRAARRAGPVRGRAGLRRGAGRRRHDPRRRARATPASAPSSPAAGRCATSCSGLVDELATDTPGTR